MAPGGAMVQKAKRPRSRCGLRRVPRDLCVVSRPATSRSGERSAEHGLSRPCSHPSSVSDDILGVLEAIPKSATSGAHPVPRRPPRQASCCVPVRPRGDPFTLLYRSPRRRPASARLTPLRRRSSSSSSSAPVRVGTCSCPIAVSVLVRLRRAVSSVLGEMRRVFSSRRVRLLSLGCPVTRSPARRSLPPSSLVRSRRVHRTPAAGEGQGAVAKSTGHPPRNREIPR